MEQYVTSQLAAKKAEDMLAPLLELGDDNSVDDSDVDSTESVKLETVKRTPMQVLKSLVVYLVLAAGMAASVAAIVYTPVIITFVMGSVCIANVPFSVIKEWKLSKVPTLRTMNNKLRDEANDLIAQVDVLTEEVNVLKPEADRADSVEKELKAMADKQKFNVNGIINLVKENESILVRMRENLRQRIYQDVITIVMKSDIDGDHKIDRKEADLLALRIRLQTEEYGVEFDSDKFLRAVGNCPSIPGVLSIAQKLLQPVHGIETSDESDDDDDDEDSDEESDDEDIYDMFYVDEEDLRKSVVGESCDLAESTDIRRLVSSKRRVSLMTCDKAKPSRRASLLSNCHRLHA